MGRIWGIILAAGESSRMGANKMLLPYGKDLIITTIIDKVLDSDIDETIIVLGSFRNDILDAIAGRDIKAVINENYKKGMLSSVQCGFYSLPEDFDAAVILLGDQPMVSTKVINLVISEYRKSKKGLVMPVYRGKRGHPLLIDARYKGDVASLDPEVGLRGILSEYPYDIHDFEVDTDEILKDIDNFQDYINETK